MKNEDIDQEFEHALREAVRMHYTPVTPPDAQSSFQRFDKTMKKRRRRQLWMQRLKMVAAAVVLMLIGATVFGNPQDSRAFSPVYRIVQQVTGEVISFVFGTTQDVDISGAKTGPPPGYGGAGGTPSEGTSDAYEDPANDISIRRTMTLEEAQSETIFQFYVPGYVPEGFELKRVEVYYRRNSEKGHMISLWYEGIDDESFGIIQNQLPINAVLTSGIHESAGTVEEIEVQGYFSLLVQYVNGRTNIRSMFNSIYIDLSGNVGKEELITIANSLK